MKRSAFPGFPPEGIEFLQALKRHNRREWFQARKAVFDAKVRAPMFQLVDALNAEMMKFAPDHVTEPERAIYRIYRDTRFSSDKTPYKTHIAAVFPRRGMERHAGAGFYFSVSPQEVEVAGGVYMPPAEQLSAIRSHLAEHHEEFRRIASARSLRTLVGEIVGDRLARVPKGFCADHPAADLVRYKQLYVFVGLDPALALTVKLLGELVKRFRVITPLVEFLNAPLIRARRHPPRDAFFV